MSHRYKALLKIILFNTGSRIFIQFSKHFAHSNPMGLDHLKGTVSFL